MTSPVARFSAIAALFGNGQNPGGSDMPAVYGRIENISPTSKNLAIPAANVFVDIDVVTTLAANSVDFVQSGPGRIKYTGLPPLKVSIIGAPFLEKQAAGTEGLNAVIVRTRATVETVVGTLGGSSEITATAVPALMFGTDDILTGDEFEMRCENSTNGNDFRVRAYYLELKPRVTT